MKRATLVLTAALAVALAAAPGADAKKVRKWSFYGDHHFKDGKSARLTDGDFFSGRARLIDNFAARSKRRFRNSKHGPRKRVYLVKGTVAVKNKKGYYVKDAQCRESVGKGSYALSTTNGVRAFFPRPAVHLQQNVAEGSIGIAAGPLSLSVPFPAVSYYTSTSTGPNVAWGSLSSRVHGWTEAWDDANPNDVLMGYAGYWAGPAKKFKFALKCTIHTITSNNDRTSRATVKVNRSF